MYKYAALLVLALSQSAVADVYYVGINSDVMAKLVMEDNLPPPENATFQDGKVWGFLGEDTPHITAYTENADDVVWMSREIRHTLTEKCGTITPDCIRPILDETGHDQEETH